MGSNFEKIIAMILAGFIMLAFQNCDGFQQDGTNGSAAAIQDSELGDDEFEDIDPETPLLPTLSGIDFSGPTSSTVGECSQAFTVHVVDRFDNPVTVTRNLTLLPDGFPSGIRYSDADCMNEDSGGFTIPADSDTYTFYLMNDIAETLLLELSLPQFASPAVLVHTSN
ncbi:MAG: hypothetical protein CL677_07160 [Bdellovibrionaceae bacterium]|nr:hypothetical protein [Pseudobdellovibrionaceae bacterium]|tara:strand:+ start:39573 stop:40076 length:504 start_codon:yes stop_codon:yes gene_type:complete